MLLVKVPVITLDLFLLFKNIEILKYGTVRKDE